MQMIKKIFIQIIFITQISAQTVLYHEYEPTSSDFKIIKWNINADSLPNWYLIEKTDNNGRVTELNFMKNGSYLSPSLCYLPTRIKYEYSFNTIAQYNYFGEDIAYADECENVFKKVYHLNDNNYIYKSENYYEYDTENHSKKEIQELKRFISEVMEENEFSVSPFIGYYQYSLSKMNKIFPISEEFNSDDFTFEELELLEINKCLKK